MLSTMALDSLFLSLLISRPAAEKICSYDMDVEGKARTRLAIIQILEYLINFSSTTLRDRSPVMVSVIMGSNFKIVCFVVAWQISLYT